MQINLNTPQDADSGATDHPQGPSPEFRLPVPFLKAEMGFGDALRAVTDRLGIPSCEPCKERQARLNQKGSLRPWEW